MKYLKTLTPFLFTYDKGSKKTQNLSSNGIYLNSKTYSSFHDKILEPLSIHCTNSAKTCNSAPMLLFRCTDVLLRLTDFFTNFAVKTRKVVRIENS